MPGTEIWTAQGVYSPAGFNGARMTSFMLKNGVALLGGFVGIEASRDQRDPFIHFTILDGNLNSNNDGGHWLNPCENSAHVVRSINNDASAVLDGFVITAGHAVSCSSQHLVDREDGAGMLVEHGNPTLIHCFFYDNEASDNGGGLCLDNASPVLLACEFSLNKTFRIGGAIASTHGSSPTLLDCVFVENIGGQGCAIYHGAWFNEPLNSAGTLTVHGGRFQGNEGVVGATTGGGITTRGGTTTISDALFDHNHANGGGALFFDETVGYVRNCIFTGNTANGDLGDAVTVFMGSDITMTQCTVTGHARRADQFADASPFIVAGKLLVEQSTLAHNGGSATIEDYGAGLFVVGDTGELVVRNSIIWANRSFEGDGIESVIESFGDADAIFEYCNIQGWDGSLDGAGNFGGDPMFIDANGLDNLHGTPDDDVRLLAGSACIDRGSNLIAAALLPLDLAGHDRFTNDLVAADLGITGGAGACAIIDPGAYEFTGNNTCPSDVDCSGFVDTDDFDAFIERFEAGDQSADYDLSGFVDTDDFDAFIQDFESGC
jgi:hypothetical protein